jgi:hypothetical protein
MLTCIHFSLVNDAAIFKDKYLSWKSWKQWCSDIFGSMSSFSDDPNVDDLQGESPALEVILYKDPQGYFAGKLTRIDGLWYLMPL